MYLYQRSYFRTIKKLRSFCLKGIHVFFDLGCNVNVKPSADATFAMVENVGLPSSENAL
jgi:hypothetical protein